MNVNSLKSFANNKKSIASDSLILAFVQCVTMVSRIVQTMLLSRKLSEYLYGTYSEGILVINFIAPFLLLGMANAITYFAGQKGINIHIYVNTIFAISIVSGCVGAALVFLSGNVITGYFDNNGLKSLMTYIAIRPGLQNLISIFQNLFIAYGRAKFIAVRNFIISIFQILVIFICVTLNGNLALIFVMLVAMDSIQVFLFFFLFRKKEYAISIIQIDLSIVKNIFSFSLPLALSTMIGTLTIYMDKLIVGRMVSVEEFALYSNMSKELPFGFIVNSFTAVVMPVLVKQCSRNTFECLKTWKSYFEFGYLVTWGLCVGAIVCSKELLEFLYSNKYSAGISIFIVYLLIACTRFSYFGIILSAFGKTKIILWCAVSTLLLNFLLNIIFIKYMGMIGPAVASLIIVTIMGIIQVTMSCKLLKCKIQELINLKLILRTIVLCLGLGAVIFKIMDNINGSYLLKLVVGYLSFISIYFVIQKKYIINNLKELNSSKVY